MVAFAFCSKWNRANGRTSCPEVDSKKADKRKAAAPRHLPSAPNGPTPLRLFPKKSMFSYRSITTLRFQFHSPHVFETKNVFGVLVASWRLIHKLFVMKKMKGSLSIPALKYISSTTVGQHVYPKSSLTLSYYGRVYCLTKKAIRRLITSCS